MVLQRLDGGPGASAGGPWSSFNPRLTSIKLLVHRLHEQNHIYESCFESMSNIYAKRQRCFHQIIRHWYEGGTVS